MCLIRVLQLFAKLCLVESGRVQATFVQKHTRALCSIQIDYGTASLSVEFIGGVAKILLMRLIAKNEAVHKRISKKKPEASSRYLKPRLPLPCFVVNQLFVQFQADKHTRGQFLQFCTAANTCSHYVPGRLHLSTFPK